MLTSTAAREVALIYFHLTPDAQHTTPTVLYQLKLCLHVGFFSRPQSPGNKKHGLPGCKPLRLDSELTYHPQIHHIPRCATTFRRMSDRPRWEAKYLQKQFLRHAHEHMAVSTAVTLSLSPGVFRERQQVPARETPSVYSSRGPSVCDSRMGRVQLPRMLFTPAP